MENQQNDALKVFSIKDFFGDFTQLLLLFFVLDTCVLVVMYQKLIAWTFWYSAFLVLLQGILLAVYAKSFAYSTKQYFWSIYLLLCLNSLLNTFALMGLHQVIDPAHKYEMAERAVEATIEHVETLSKKKNAIMKMTSEQIEDVRQETIRSFQVLGLLINFVGKCIGNLFVALLFLGISLGYRQMIPKSGSSQSIK
jgi:hypothetical protein